ncbi:PTS system mannose/fructose/sorbose family transporter subunit IID, partial [Glycomyces tenuis]|uniref:PTS system mannose/fructose/sorbose family transporter subunit IID n=1 Tax=Glycomyces tenuis TaxID=58116 RepID=UPI0012DF9D60
ALVIFVIGRRDLLPWFFIGYFFVAYSSIPVLGAAIFGVCVVLLIAGYTRSRNVSAVEAEERPSADDRAAHSPEPERGPGNTTTTDAELAPGADGIPTLTEKDVRKSWFRYYLFAETGISYERLQALGFTHGLLPILKKLYPKKADLSAAMQRHLVFYNTEAVFGAPINGVVISMEEQRAHGKPITDDAITGIKTGLMGPMAGLGDSIDWATMKPLIFALAAALGATGNIFAPFILLLLPLFQIIVGLNLATTGYRQGRSSIQDLLRSGRVKELITGASTLGLFMMGVLSATYISLTTPLSFQFGDGNEPFVVQDILDGLAPGILPLLVVLGLYFTLRRRKQNLGLIALILVAIALLGALAGIF